jgi:hypothetical protein
MFSIYRYIVPLELIGSLVLLTSMWAVLSGLGARTRAILATIGCVIVVFSTVRPDWGRKEFGADYFGVKVPQLPSNSLVLLYGYEPLAYILPFLGEKNRYVRVTSNLTNLSHRHGLQREIDFAIRTHSGPIYALRGGSGDSDPSGKGAGAQNGLEKKILMIYQLGLKAEGCAPIYSSLDDGLQLCPLEKAARR